VYNSYKINFARFFKINNKNLEEIRQQALLDVINNFKINYYDIYKIYKNLLEP